MGVNVTPNKKYRISFFIKDTYTGDVNDPLSLNLFTYCHNEPLMYWDPDGHNYTYINGQGYTGNDLANGEHWLEAMGVKRSEAPYVKKEIVEGIRYAASNPSILTKAGNKVSSFFNANMKDRYLSPTYYVPVGEYIDDEDIQNSDPYYLDQINPYTGKSFRQGFFDYKMKTDKAFAKKISDEMNTDWFMEGLRYGTLKSTIGIVDMPYELRQAGRQSATYGGIGVQPDATDKPVITHKVPQYGPNINKFNSGKFNGTVVGTSFSWATSELVVPYAINKVASLLGKFGTRFPAQISMLESEIEFMANGQAVNKVVSTASEVPSVLNARIGNNGIVNGRNPAERLANKLSNLPKNQRPNSVTVIRTQSGKYLVSTNRTKYLNKDVAGILDELGNVNEFNRGCGEVSAVSRGFKKGWQNELAGADVYTAYVRGPNSTSGLTGAYHSPCSVCGPMLDFLKMTAVEW